MDQADSAPVAACRGGGTSVRLQKLQIPFPIPHFVGFSLFDQAVP
jgi:hypothetical protein